MRIAILAILLVCGLASYPLAAQADPVNLVAATDGTTFFNRPGATRQQHDTDLKACMLIVRQSSGEPMTLTQGTAPGLMVQAFFNYAKRNRLENCMLVRGWRVVRLDAAEAAQLAKLDPAALASRLAPMIGADPPDGALMRRWDNEGLRSSTVREAMPGLVVGRNLSLDSLDLNADPEFAASMGRARLPEIPYKRFVNRPTTVDKLGALAPDAAVIVLTLRARSNSIMNMVGLIRVGPDPLTFPADNDPVGYNPDLWRAKPGGDGLIERTYAFAAPPGRWALSMLGGQSIFCLGSPFFDLKAGDVVYAGRFDFSQESLIPDMSLEGPRAMLNASPLLASRLRPAEWTNGATWVCQASIYALEFPAAPYAPGYRRAGAPP